MKNCEFNKAYERAKKVDIVNDAWFNYAGFFWINLTQRQHDKMVVLLLQQGAKPEPWRDELWIKLKDGLRLRVAKEVVA